MTSTNDNNHGHTILLVQTTEEKSSRVWSDYSSKHEAYESLLKMHEEHLTVYIYMYVCILLFICK